jgi:ribosomal protein S12
MPTINQLVRKPRVKVVTKSKVPALEAVRKSVVYVLVFIPLHLKSQTQLCVKLQKYV